VTALAGQERWSEALREFDALRDDGERYATRLRRTGVVVTGVRYTGMIHDFLLFGGAIDASRMLIEQVAAALRPLTHHGEA